MSKVTEVTSRIGSMRHVIRGAGCALVAAAVMAMPLTASAEEWKPSKTVRILVPVAPGGTTDFLGRLLAQYMTNDLGQQVIVENKPGGGNVIGTEALVSSAPDGHTIGMIGSPHSANVTLLSNLPYDSIEDIQPVSLLGKSSFLMVVNEQLPFRSVSDLIESAKKNPRSIHYGTPAVGSGNHLASELFNSMTGAGIVHIPYKGGGPAMNDLMGGQIQMMFNAFPSTLPFVKEGKFRALAITGDTRSPMLPDVPTMVEAGVPDFVFYDWWGIILPPKTPENIVSAIRASIEKFQNDETIKTRLQERGIESVMQTPAEFREFLVSDIKRTADIISKANIKVQ